MEKRVDSVILANIATGLLREGVRLVWADPGSEYAGRVSWQDGRWRIALRSDLAADALLRVLVHEIGHVLAGHVAKSGGLPADEVPAGHRFYSGEMGAKHRSRERAADAIGIPLLQTLREAWRESGRDLECDLRDELKVSQNDAK